MPAAAAPSDATAASAAAAHGASASAASALRGKQQPTTGTAPSASFTSAPPAARITLFRTRTGVIENVDVTHLASGHLEYPRRLEAILGFIGLEGAAAGRNAPNPDRGEG